jgi:hypothetical protein
MQELRYQFYSAVANLTSAQGVPTKFKEKDVTGDGSCFFHAVGYFLGMDGHDLRRLTARFIIEFQDAEDASGITLRQIITESEDGNPELVNAYAHRLEHNNMWGGAEEMKALFLASNGRLRINVYTRNADQSYEPVHRSPYPDANVHLLYVNEVHYRALVSVVPASRPQRDPEILLARQAKAREYENHLERLALEQKMKRLALEGDKEFATFLGDAETIKEGGFIHYAIMIVTEDFKDSEHGEKVANFMQTIAGLATKTLRELEKLSDLKRFVRKYAELCKNKIEEYLDSKGVDKAAYKSLERLGNLAN